MTAPVVSVLLSTFNGAAYLDQQLESLQAQIGVCVRLCARDDGSQDRTPEILQQWAQRWTGVESIACGPNLGPVGSFFELLTTAPDDADFFAFCDQDDVWQADKLARATAALAGEAGPALYCSNVMLVNQALAPIGIPAANGDAGFHHILFENVAFGCTMLLNRAARDLIVSDLPQNGVVMHDWWCALVIAAFGRVYFDPQPSILYRQHTGNAVGLSARSGVQAWREARRLVANPRTFFRAHAQAAEFSRIFKGRLSPSQRHLVEDFVASKRSAKARIAYAARGPVRRRRKIDGAIIRSLIAMGWY